MKRMILIPISMLLFLGCAADQQRIQYRRILYQSTIPTCNTPEDCTTKWSAAQAWVSQNCQMKIQIATDTLIETYNSIGMRLACKVVKEPIGSGMYRLIITTGCSNMFGCYVDPWDAAINFNQYVNSLK